MTQKVRHIEQLCQSRGLSITVHKGRSYNSSAAQITAVCSVSFVHRTSCQLEMVCCMSIREQGPFIQLKQTRGPHCNLNVAFDDSHLTP